MTPPFAGARQCGSAEPRPQAAQVPHDARAAAATTAALRPLQSIRSRLDLLLGTQQRLSADRERAEQKLNRLGEYLAIADGVAAALDKLSEDLFGSIVRVLEQNLTLALQEVLEQPITLKVDRDYKRGTATIRFHIECQGQPEDIMRGQGGSVANILSVGLRMFALARLPAQQHRRFLVLDEQDCWLHPELVPRLVKIVHEAGRALGFQVLMISHHDAATFERYADKIYRLSPDPNGLRVQVWRRDTEQPIEIEAADNLGSMTQSCPELPLFQSKG
jgi:DNA repair exonuclease SbcCD ATPase subunit